MFAKALRLFFNRRSIAGLFLFAGLVPSVVVGQIVNFTSLTNDVPTIRSVGIDGLAFIRDEIHIPLVGPSGDLQSDGSRQEFNVNLNGGKILLSSEFSHFSFDVIFYPFVFGAANDSEFYPPDASDVLLLGGTNVIPSQDASMQEYLLREPGPTVSTLNLLFFASESTSSLLINPGLDAEVDSLTYLLDIPAALVNMPSISLASPILRVLARTSVPIGTENDVEFGVLLVPEPSDLKLVIEALVDDGVLNRGQGNSLLVKLNFNSNQQATPNRIEALINQINAFVNAGILTSVEGELLIDGAENLRDNLSVAGDFDADGNLDGADFLKWQRGDRSTAGLTLWENNYGTNSSSNSAALQNIPEPSSFALIMLCSCSLLSRRQLSRF